MRKAGRPRVKEVDPNERPCEVPGCERATQDRRMCSTHYWRQKNGKPLDAPRGLNDPHYVIAHDDGSNRTCVGCGETKPHSEYYKRQDGQVSGNKCRQCRSRAALDWWYRDLVKNRHEQNRNKQARRYGMTREQYDSELDRRQGQCDMCGEVNGSLCVDHDHKCCPGDGSCGACVRGFLCRMCNTALGMMRDDPSRLRAALDYLAAWTTAAPTQGTILT